MKNTGKIPLISLYSTDAIGLRYIKAFLKKKEFASPLILFKEKHLTSDLMSAPTENEYTLLIELLKDLDPSAVGISLRSSFFNIALLITEKVKQEIGVPIIWGGTHPTIAPWESIQIADMICIGEGEFPLLELAQRLSLSEDYSDIQNLWIRKNGQVIKNEEPLEGILSSQ